MFYHLYFYSKHCNKNDRLMNFTNAVIEDELNRSMVFKHLIQHISDLPLQEYIMFLNDI